MSRCSCCWALRRGNVGRRHRHRGEEAKCGSPRKALHDTLRHLCVAYRKLMESGKEHTRGYSASDDDCSQIGCLARPCQGNLPLQQEGDGCSGSRTGHRKFEQFSSALSLFPLSLHLWCCHCHLFLGDGTIRTPKQRFQVAPSPVLLDCNVSVSLQFEAKFLAHLASLSSHVLSTSPAACLSTNLLGDRPNDAIRPIGELKRCHSAATSRWRP